MPSIQPPAVSRDRRQHVMRLIQRSGILTAAVSDDARVTYVLGALICDDAGRISEQQLAEAGHDPGLLALAHNMLAVASLGPAGLN